MNRLVPHNIKFASRMFELSSAPQVSKALGLSVKTIRIQLALSNLLKKRKRKVNSIRGSYTVKQKV